MVYDRARLFGALLELMPGFTPWYVNTVFPAVALGLGASARGKVSLFSGSTLYFFASCSQIAWICLTLSGIFAARSLACE